MRDRIKWTIISIIVFMLCLVVVIAPLIAADILFPRSTTSNHSEYNGGVVATYEVTALVDKSLSNCINLTCEIGTGEGGQGYSWTTVSGNLTWTGTLQDSIKSIQNLHLAVYTRLDENSSLNENTRMLTIGIHAIVNQSKPTIPTDSIDYHEIIIPSFGLDTPTYTYSLNCSTYTN